MFRFDFSRAIFMVSAVVLLAVTCFAAGLYSYQTENSAYRLVRGLKNDLETLVDAEKRERALRGPMVEHLQPSRGQGNGVMTNKTPDDGARIMMAGFFDGENQVRLVERNGSVVAKWSLDYFAHFPDPASRPCNFDDPLESDLHGALLTPAGELVVNYEYCGTVKLGPCGNLVWALNHPTHHSVVRAEDGGYLVLGRESWHTDNDPDRFPPMSKAFRVLLEDLILRVSEDGEIVESISIPQLFYDSGLEALLTSNAGGFRYQTGFRHEIVHANKIAELNDSLAPAFPMFEAGDLLLSLKGLNLLMVVDPEAGRIRWHRTGPWLRQHDPEFRPDGRISVFNNNMYRDAYDAEGYTRADVPPKSNIIAIDPGSLETEILFGEKPGQELLSVIRGQHEVLSDGGMIVTEFDSGRVVQISDEAEVVWEYVNRFDDDFVGEITNADLFQSGYFEAAIGACS